MNIFILDNDHVKNAKYHCDKHVVKQISEYAQLLATAIYETTGCVVAVEDAESFFKLYPKCATTTIKPTHKNHPCAKWVRESQENFDWLLSLLLCLHDEWIVRYGHNKDKVHASVYKLLNAPNNRAILPSIGITAFPQAMPDEYRNSDPVKAYRTYYNNAKRDLFQWTNTDIPYWIE